MSARESRLFLVGMLTAATQLSIAGCDGSECECGLEQASIEAGAIAEGGTAKESGTGKAATSGGRIDLGAGSGGRAAGRAGSGAAGMTTEAGSGGEAGAMAGTGGDPECDESKSPKDEPCLIADEYAVFVAPTGVSGAAGTMDAPLPTVSAGIAAAVANEVPRVIVCAGTYAETVEITAGIQVYGGFDCGEEPWEVASAAVTLVQPSVKGEALRIVDVADAVVIEGIEFESMDGDSAGESSVAALVKGSAAVTLRRVKITAGDGVDGANGITEDFPEWPKTGRTEDECVAGKGCLAGRDADGEGNGGGLRRYDQCAGGGLTMGGSGGDDVVAASEQRGQDGIPEYDDGVGIGGDGGASCESGDNGAAGPAGMDMGGAATLGNLNDGQWQASSGTAGAHGTIGQGGGGGGAKSGAGGGGGGGAGGCGGHGGAAGTGGGASIALLAVASTLTMLNSTLVTSAAGDGGNGAAGLPGMQHGGTSGAGDGGCPGGVGGPGGKGGAGGGGAGGISVGIVWTGTKPVVDENTSITWGTAGNGGAGGAATNGGVPGIAQDDLQV